MQDLTRCLIGITWHDQIAGHQAKGVSGAGNNNPAFDRVALFLTQDTQRIGQDIKAAFCQPFANRALVMAEPLAGANWLPWYR